MEETAEGPCRYTVFASNDYLGLAGHPEIREIVAQTVKAYGMGPRSSALVAGYTHLHAKLESKLAQLMHKECALLFPTGDRYVETALEIDG